MSEDVQRRARDLWAGQSLYAVTVRDGWFTVHQHTPDGGVFPPIEYATPHEALSRLAQLMDVKDAIEPQTWPERVKLG